MSNDSQWDPYFPEDPFGLQKNDDGSLRITEDDSSTEQTSQHISYQPYTPGTPPPVPSQYVPSNQSGPPTGWYRTPTPPQPKQVSFTKVLAIIGAVILALYVFTNFISNYESRSSDFSDFGIERAEESEAPAAPDLNALGIVELELTGEDGDSFLLYALLVRYDGLLVAGAQGLDYSSESWESAKLSLTSFDDDPAVEILKIDKTNGLVFLQANPAELSEYDVITKDVDFESYVVIITPSRLDMNKLESEDSGDSVTFEAGEDVPLGGIMLDSNESVTLGIVVGETTAISNGGIQGLIPK